MDRAERLRAMVAELRAVAPRPLAVTWLARRFAVSVRTVERDLDALRESGVPISAAPGRLGGYALEEDRALPPLALTLGEALAIGAALRAVGDSPFAAHAHAAWRKIHATLPPDVRLREEALAARVHQAGDPLPVSRVAGVVARAIEQQRVLHLTYYDTKGARTERDVEPIGLLCGPHGWYLLAWCRLRRGVRGFVLDRMRAAEMRDEPVPPYDDSELGREMSAWGAGTLRDVSQ